MAQIFGNYCEEEPNSNEYLIIGFSPSSVPLKHRWRNNGLSADFLADYLTTFFPNVENAITGNSLKAEIKSAVGFIANELLENAMKFNDESSYQAISIKLELHDNKLIFFVANSINQHRFDKLRNFIERLMNSDPSELYICQLEENAQDDDKVESNLGLLTMINDYQATLGWKFETLPENPLIMTVTTRVELLV